jgi:stage II sporulation protein D
VVIFRRAIVLVLLLSALVVGRASAGFAPPALKGTPQFVISGHGWGHAVGMGQWGAYGYAQHGFTYDKILAHYYPGTVLSTTTVKSIRVLLANTKSVTISSTGPWKLKDGSAATTTMPAGKVTLNPELKFKLPDGAEAETFTGPLTFTAAAPLVFKKPYRGTFTVTSDGKKITLVNTVPLEQYLYAVVPSEMPKTWLPEALKTQAVAARSYALAVRKTSGPFDVYDDTRSQVYGGKDSESVRTNRATKRTAGEVVRQGKQVATTYFFSTSGGRTESVQYGFPGAAPVSYLKSVRDPYDGASPYHTWTVRYSQDEIESRLSGLFSGRLRKIRVLKHGDSPRIVRARVVGSKGSSNASGPALQSLLALKSTWARFHKR